MRLFVWWCYVDDTFLDGNKKQKDNTFLRERNMYKNPDLSEG